MADDEMHPEQQFLRAVFPNELSEPSLAIPFAPGSEPLLRELRQAIDGALDSVSYRERGILEMRFALGDGHAYTLAQVGYVFQLTRERIRQLQVKALRKLRQRAGDLKDFVDGLRRAY